MLVPTINVGINPDARNELSEGLIPRGSAPIPMFVSIPTKNVETDFKGWHQASSVPTHSKER